MENSYDAIISTIRTAIYGRDMREAIAKGFEMCKAGGGGGSTVFIDKTLTRSDYAADAKVVGDRFLELESQIANIDPGLSREEKDAILNYFEQQVEIHPELKDAYDVIYNLWNIPVASVTLDRKSIELAKGMTVKLVATVEPSNAYDKTVTWSSDPEGIVSVVDGLVLALKEGSTTIKASCGGKSDTCSVKVTEEKTYYSVTRNLTHVTSSNMDDNVVEGSSYHTSLTVDYGYKLNSVKITMNGYDITSSAYDSSDHTISINSVNGDIILTATASYVLEHNITYNLDGVTVSPKPSTIEDGESLSLTLRVDNSTEYQFSTVTVRMGYTDITSTVLSPSDPTSVAYISIPSVTSDITITADTRTKYKDLNSCTWSEISQISSSGQAANHFAVGDSKTINFNGSRIFRSTDDVAGYLVGDMEVFILGINHNASIEGNNLIHFCLGKKNGELTGITSSYYEGKTVLSDSFSFGMFVMNVENENNSSGWAGTYIYKDAFNNESGSWGSNGPTRSYGVANGFPSDLVKVIKPVIKYYSTSSSAKSCRNYLFLMSSMELTGTHAQYADSRADINQVQYDYFKSGNSKDANGLKIPTSSSDVGSVSTVTGYYTRTRVDASSDTWRQLHYIIWDQSGYTSTLNSGIGTTFRTILPCFCV